MKPSEAMQHVLDDDDLIPRATSSCRAVVREAIPLAQAMEAVVEAAQASRNVYDDPSASFYQVEEVETRLDETLRHYESLTDKVKQPPRIDGCG